MCRPAILDTWAWIEVLRGSSAGEQVVDRFLNRRPQVVWTVDITFVELAASLHRDGYPPERLEAAVKEVMARSDRVLVPEVRDAVAAPYARAALRARKKDASLADGLILAMARNRGADVVTCDRAFEGEPDAICPHEARGA